VIQVAGLIFGAILIFVLVSGLVVLWRRGADDLDAWGVFVMRVLRGERRRTAPPPDLPEKQSGRPRSWRDDDQPQRLSAQDPSRLAAFDVLPHPEVQDRAVQRKMPSSTKADPMRPDRQTTLGACEHTRAFHGPSQARDDAFP